MGKEKNDTILFVDDDKVLCFLFKRSFGNLFNIEFAKDATEALEVMDSSSVNVILSDHHLPGITGIELLKMVKVKYPSTTRIFVTGSEDEEIRKTAERECEIAHFIPKPWDETKLKEILTDIISKNN